MGQEGLLLRWVIAAAALLSGVDATTIPFFVTGPQFQIDATIDGTPTQVLGTELQCSSDIDRGLLQNGQLQYDLTCGAPIVKWVYGKFATVPRATRLMFSQNCIGDQTQYELNLNQTTDNFRITFDPGLLRLLTAQTGMLAAAEAVLKRDSAALGGDIANPATWNELTLFAAHGWQAAQEGVKHPRSPDAAIQALRIRGRARALRSAQYRPIRRNVRLLAGIGPIGGAALAFAGPIGQAAVNADLYNQIDATNRNVDNINATLFSVWNTVNDSVHDIKVLNDSVLALQAGTIKLGNSVAGDEANIGNLQLQASITLGEVVDNTNGIASAKLDEVAITATCVAMAGNITKNFQTVEDQMNTEDATNRKRMEELAQLQQQASAQNVALCFEASNFVMNTTIALTTQANRATHEQMKTQDKRIQQLGDMIVDVQVDMYQQGVHYQLRKDTTNSHFNHTAGLDPQYFTMTSNDGIPPQPGGLQGPDLRTLVQKFRMNYVGTSTCVSGSCPVITSHEIQILSDVVYSFGVAQPMITSDWILRRMVRENCTRPFIGYDSHGNLIQDNIGYRNFSACRFWIEVVTTTCIGKSATFTWSTALNNTTPADQPFQINATMCDGGITSTSTVYRKFTDWLNWYSSTSACAQTKWANSANEFQLTEFMLSGVKDRGHERIYITGDTSQCVGTVQELNGLGLVSPFAAMFGWYMRSLPFYRYNVGVLKMKAQGRLPLGIRFDYAPMMYTASHRDPLTGDPIYDSGAEPDECIISSWTVVDRTVIGVYAITPKQGDFITKNIAINDVTATGVTEYDNTDLTQTVTLALDDSPILPANLIILGDITSGPLIYDVPDRLVGMDADVRARENTAMYILMRPDATETGTFEELVALNGPSFTSGNPHISAHSYSFNRALDGTGAPYCNITGGVPNPNNRLTLDQTSVSPAAIPNGRSCVLLKFFQVSSAVRDGQLELQARPREWAYRATVYGFSGRFTDIIDSFCPTVTPEPHGSDGMSLIFHNQRAQDTTIRVVLNTTDPTNDPACRTIFILVVPGATPTQTEGLKERRIPQCPTLTVQMYRLTVDASTGDDAVVSCGDPIPAGSIQTAISGYQGLDVDVASSIEVRASDAEARAGAIIVGVLKVVQESQDAITRSAIVDQGEEDAIRANLNAIYARYTNMPIPALIEFAQNFTMNTDLTSAWAPVLDRVVNDSDSFLAVQANNQVLNVFLRELAANTTRDNANNLNNTKTAITDLQNAVGPLIAIRPLAAMALATVANNIFADVFGADIGSGLDDVGSGVLDLAKDGVKMVGAFGDKLLSVPGQLVDKLADAAKGLLNGVFGALDGLFGDIGAIILSVVSTLVILLIYHFAYVKKQLGRSGGGGSSESASSSEKTAPERTASVELSTPKGSVGRRSPSRPSGRSRSAERLHDGYRHTNGGGSGGDWGL